MKKYFVVLRWIDLLYLILFGVILYVYLRSDTGVPEITNILFGFFFVAAVIFFYIYRWQNYTLRFIGEFAKKYNFKSTDLKLSDLASTNNEIDLFNTQGDARIANYYRNDKVAIYNYRLPAVISTDYDRKNEQSLPTWFIVFDFQLSNDFEPITILNKKDSRKFKVIHHRPLITTESNQFNSRYLVYGKDRKTILEVIDPIMMSALIDCSYDLNFEISGNRLLIYKCSKPISVDFIDYIYQFGQKMVVRLGK